MLENRKHRRRVAAWIVGVLAAVLITVPTAAVALDQNPKVSVYGTDVTVGSLFRQIEDQTGYTFAYNKSALDLSRRVTLQFANADIDDVLDNILKGSDFTYILSDKHILILPQKEFDEMQQAARKTAPKKQVQPYQPKPQQQYQPQPEPQYPEQKPQTAVPQAAEPYIGIVEPVIYTAPQQQVVTTTRERTPRASAVITEPLAPLEMRNVPQSPNWALKTNLLFDATTTINLGFEVRLSKKWTMELTGSYNPWSWPDNRKWKTILVQPEARFWLCDPFAGHFLGVHAHWAHYNWGNLPFGSLRYNRYQGDLVGAGISYGYSWYLGRRWALEATIGVGYAYMWYQRFDQEVCGNCYGWENKDYIGITKLGVSISWLIK